MSLTSRLFGVFAAALAGVLLCGCTAAEDMQEHQTETPITIKVGSDNYPPFNYTDENGNIITDGYGYIDPYTGSYIN